MHGAVAGVGLHGSPRKSCGKLIEDGDTRGEAPTPELAS